MKITKNSPMKIINNILILLVLLSQVIFCKASVHDNDNGLITYTDNTYSISMSGVNRTINKTPLSSARSSEVQEIRSRLGNIIASYDDNYFMTDGVKHCIKLAMDSWEERITIQKPIRFHVCISESMSPEVAISTTVGYSMKQGNALPDNLYNQDTLDDVALSDTMRINVCIDWNTTWPYDGFYNGTVNLTNGILKNIARILGFATSFDQLATLPINKETLDVLKEIGWNVKETDCAIYCDDTDALGYGPVYKEYSFILKEYDSKELKNAKWRYQLLNPETCQYETIDSGIGNQFCVTPTIDANSMDEYQCMQARIVSEYDEREFSFPLTLEARPMIENIEVSDYVTVDDLHCQIDINISQRGATHGTILVSDDTGAVREYNYSDGTITVGNLRKGFPVYVDVTLYNEYGSANKFVEKESYTSGIAGVTGDMPSLTIAINGKNVTIPFEEGTPIKILSFDGKVITSRDLQQGLSLQLPHGLYIIQPASGNKYINKKISVL